MSLDERFSNLLFKHDKAVRETHVTRDPLEGIDRIYIPDGPNHDWGQQADPARVSHTESDTVKGKMNAGGHGESDADKRLESQEGKKPTKPDTHKI